MIVTTDSFGAIVSSYLAATKHPRTRYRSCATCINSRTPGLLAWSGRWIDPLDRLSAKEFTARARWSKIPRPSDAGDVNIKGNADIPSTPQEITQH